MAGSYNQKPELNNTAMYRGRIIQAASAYLYALDAMHRDQLDDNPAIDLVVQNNVYEFQRLIDNEVQMRESWGNYEQLAKLIIFMTEGYIPEMP